MNRSEKDTTIALNPILIGHAKMVQEMAKNLAGYITSTPNFYIILLNNPEIVEMLYNVVLRKSRIRTTMSVKNDEHLKTIVRPVHTILAALMKKLAEKEASLLKKKRRETQVIHPGMGEQPDIMISDHRRHAAKPKKIPIAIYQDKHYNRFPPIVWSWDQEHWGAMRKWLLYDHLLYHTRSKSSNEEIATRKLIKEWLNRLYSLVDVVNSVLLDVFGINPQDRSKYASKSTYQYVRSILGQCHELEWVSQRPFSLSGKESPIKTLSKSQTQCNTKMNQEKIALKHELEKLLRDRAGITKADVLRRLVRRVIRFCSKHNANLANAQEILSKLAIQRQYEELVQNASYQGIHPTAAIYANAANYNHEKVCSNAQLKLNPGHVSKNFGKEII